MLDSFSFFFAVLTARTLRRIAAKIGVAHWNFSVNPCDSESMKCDCSFYNNTTCHVTGMYVCMTTWHFSY